MTKKKSDNGAVLQFEFDRKRIGGYSTAPGIEKPNDRIYHIAHCAAWDTIANGGTFVLVVTADKITMVQRPDAEEFDETQAA